MESLPDTYKVQANGSTIKGFQNGTEHSSVTDSAINGNTQAGISGGTNSGGTIGDVKGDNFEASDLGATLSTLTLDADGTRDAVIENDTGDTPVYDHGNDAPDGVSSDSFQNDNSESSGVGWFSLSNVNANFDSMDKLDIDVDV